MDPHCANAFLFEWHIQTDAWVMFTSENVQFSFKKFQAWTVAVSFFND